MLICKFNLQAHLDLTGKITNLFSTLLSRNLKDFDNGGYLQFKKYLGFIPVIIIHEIYPQITIKYVWLRERVAQCSKKLY